MNENLPDNPQIQVLKSGKTGLFTNYIYKAIPLAFDESMSYYETLCGLLNYLKNVVIPTVNNNADAVAELQSLYGQLRTYVDNYFTNLDVQEEINNKLDNMVEDGTLPEIIASYLNSKAVFGFDNVASMKNSTNLINGSYAETLGYYSKNDGGSALYKIRTITNDDIVDEATIIALQDNTLIAELIVCNVKPEIFGAYGDGTHNDTLAFQKTINYILSKQVLSNNEYSNIPSIILTKQYLIDKITLPTGLQILNIKGQNARIKTGGFKFPNNVGWKIHISGITFDTCNNPIDFEYRNVEYGKYEIENCTFLSCTGTAISIKRKSCQSLINKCTFRYCEKSVYVEDNDMCIFTNNWLECNSLWENNHFDVEQYSPNTAGIIKVENNLFIPGISQTNQNPCWLKVGYSANIINNRFSGENPTIHPLTIDFDQNTFNITNTIYPIINFANNPNVTGNPTILIKNARGEINISNNSGWVGGKKIMALYDESYNDTFDNLDYTDLTITFNNNTGRPFNFRNEKGIVTSAYRPSVDNHLQRFIKKTKTYQDNHNFELKASVDNYVLNIEYCTTDLKKTDVIIINGTVNKNPGGSDYFEPFIALLTIERYYDTELRYRGNCNIITSNKQEITFNVLINGSEYITALPQNENVKFSISCTSPKRPTFTNIDVLNMCPISNTLSN